MKLLKVQSRLTGETLAQLRAVQDEVQVVSDKTNGMISQVFESGLTTGKQKLDRSSALALVQDDTGIQIHRYLLANGDLVQITSDGVTVVLNGQILDEDYKQRLLQALAEQQLTVIQKSPGVGPEAFYQPKPVDMLEQERKEILRQKFTQTDAYDKALASKKPKKTHNYDPDLEKLIRQHPKHGRPFFKKLAYLLTYGDKKNGRSKRR